MTEDHIGRAVPGWQPIDSAPLGDWVQIKFGEDEGDEDGPYIARKLAPDIDWLDKNGSDFNYGFDEPTHWRPAPLPDPPEVTK